MTVSNDRFGDAATIADHPRIPTDIHIHVVRITPSKQKRDFDLRQS
jgi:hypothetical protein